MINEHQKSRSQSDRGSSMSKASGQWEFLKGKFEAGQLGHAYLLSGYCGIYKKEFAKEFIKLINCIFPNLNGPKNQEKYKKSCGQCQNCKLIESETFPDLLVIKSSNSKSSVDNEKDMMEIDISQIREVNNFLSYKAYYGHYKAVIMEDAEKMNVEAQSCFLKTLEEPKGKTIIFLISSKPEILLPTIFSRCQTIKFFSAGKYKATEEQKRILSDLLGIIDSGLSVKFDYTKKVNLEENNFNKILEVLQRYFRNLLFKKIGIKNDSVESKDHYDTLKIKNIIRLIENLNTQISTTNASPKLALEILLLEI